MADPFADSDDYATRTGQVLSDGQIAQVTALLEESSELIREHAAGLDARMAAGSPAVTLVTGVCVRVVQRYLANPTQASQLVKGPFSVAYAAANARGLYLTEDDLSGLLPAGKAAAGVGTIRVGLPVGTVGQRRRRRW